MALFNGIIHPYKVDYLLKHYINLESTFAESFFATQGLICNCKAQYIIELPSIKFWKRTLYNLLIVHLSRTEVLFHHIP